MQPPEQALAVSHHAVNPHAGGLLRCGNRLSGKRRARQDFHLCAVVLHIERLCGRFVFLAGAAGAQPHGGHQIGQTHGGNGKAHRGEVEHGETEAGFLITEIGNEQVGRGADERDLAAEQGGERQRHEDDPRRIFEAAGGGQRQRQHERERRDVVHEGGEHQSQPALQGHVQAGAGRERGKPPPQKINRAGLGNGPADDQNGRHGDDGGIAEAGEGILRRNEPEEHARHEADGGDDVVPPPVEAHGHQRSGKNEKKKALARGHVAKVRENRAGAQLFLGCGKVGSIAKHG